MDVIIVSKTRMSSAVCVGGILKNGRAVRLLTQNGSNQEVNIDMNIGDVYEITFSERNDKKAPHNEDILIQTKAYKHNFSSMKEMVDYLFDNVEITFWAGNISKIYDGTLQWTGNGSGYISEKGGIPKNSVGFWMPDKDLTRIESNEKVRYKYNNDKNIPYVGLQGQIETIPAGTLIRVSLARWWSPDINEERCYLQISGWYLDTK